MLWSIDHVRKWGGSTGGSIACAEDEMLWSIDHEEEITGGRVELRVWARALRVLLTRGAFSFSCFPKHFVTVCVGGPILFEQSIDDVFVSQSSSIFFSLTPNQH